MFNIKDVIGWIGNVAVVPQDDGCWLVDWGTGKQMFVKNENEEADGEKQHSQESNL